MTAMNKRQLRAHLRALHAGENARDTQSAAICCRILESSVYQNARVVGGYMPLPHEADIRPVLEDALRQGKTLALPLCDEPPHMTLRRVTDLASLHIGAYGIPEPSSDCAIIAVEEVDLLLVPLEGIDREGFRLGKGGGYYDHLLLGKDVCTVGCALSWQWVAELPRDPWDQPMHACTDESGLHVFSQKLIERKETHHGREEETAEDRQSLQALSER